MAGISDMTSLLHCMIIYWIWYVEFGSLTHFYPSAHKGWRGIVCLGVICLSVKIFLENMKTRENSTLPYHFSSINLYYKKILVKFKGGLPWPTFQGNTTINKGFSITTYVIKNSSWNDITLCCIMAAWHSILTADR